MPNPKPYKPIAKVALATPVPRLFDYKISTHQALQAGQRVEVMFGRRNLVGLVVAIVAESDIAPSKLKTISQILDTNPVLDADLIELLCWSSHYYRHPVGEVILQALPARLRQGQPAEYVTDNCWLCNPDISRHDAETMLKRAAKQYALYQWLAQQTGKVTREQLNQQFENWHAPLKALVEKKLIIKQPQPLYPAPCAGTKAPTLTDEQQQAVSELSSQQHFQVSMLQGITGSGKTEVYLACIESVLASNKQVLVLVPEIGLTPQLVQRFQQRLAVSVGVAHSGLSDTQRHNIWLAARRGDIQVLIGTRSAVFTPFSKLGLIVIDEEHDASLKQHEGFRYHARDVAIYRARQANIPVILGSATPSLETLYNCEQQKFQRILLQQRAGDAALPRMQLVDVRGQKLVENIFSAQLIQQIRTHLKAGNQVLLFLNRRGYAPVLMCHDCGWLSHCPRCDAFMTFHHQKKILRCHHCDYETAVPEICPECESENIAAMGSGTERIEHALHELFPDVTYVRIDRDTSRGKNRLPELLQQAHSGKARILIGTQMLAKGHDIPGVTFVGILNTDQGFYSSDFRASERMGQLIVQVAGRAGRALHDNTQQSEVMIQTHHPDNPLFQPLLHHNYTRFGQILLAERQMAQLPPYSYQVMLRADAQNESAPFEFLQQARDLIGQIEAIEVYGPMPAPMARRAGRIRAQLLCQAETRQTLQQLLNLWLPKLYEMKGISKLRWSVDVDPIDSY